MKQAVFLFGSVVSMMVFGTEMKYESYFFNDDFERSEMRSGNPERVTGMIAPGLLSQTTMGRYRGSSVTILPERDGLKVPIAGKLKLAFGYRLYSLGAEASSVLLTHFKKGEQGLLFKTERTCASPVVKCTLGANLCRSKIADISAFAPFSKSINGSSQSASTGKESLSA